MKKSLVLFAMFAVGVSMMSAQEDYPIPPKRSRAAKVGFFGGFTPAWLNVNVAPINTFLEGAHAAPLKEDGVFLWGGAGAAYIMLIPNLRIGGMGLSGSISSTSLDQFGVRRDAKLTAGFGGLTAEYVIPVVERLDVSFGVMAGWGGIDLQLRQDIGGNRTWGDEWTAFGSGNYQIGGQITNITRTLSGSFFVWVPSFTVEYAVLGYLAVRGGVSYAGMSAPSWSVDGKYDLLGVPSDVSGKGLMVTAGILLGTF